MPKQRLLQKYIDPETTIDRLLAEIPVKKENKVEVVKYLIEEIGSMEELERIYLQTVLKRKFFHPEKFLRRAISEYILTHLEKYIPNTVRIWRKDLIWKKDLPKRNNPGEKLVVELTGNCIEILAKNTAFLNQLQDNTVKILRIIFRLIYEISDIVSFKKDVLQQEITVNKKQLITETKNPIRTLLELYQILNGKENKLYIIYKDLLSLIEIIENKK